MQAKWAIIANMIHRTILTMADGVRIVVPDSLGQITAWVLREQGDWFEDEIKFARKVVTPGQRVIDIGANYGVYTLALARATGPAGRVWAFEPASATAEMLAASIAENGFDNVSLQRQALSNRNGEAMLSLHAYSENNSLVNPAAGGACESVALATLDGAADALGWQDIDFLKIDAEGEEMNIIAGGADFFRRCSPLVQYEIKAGSELNLDLVAAFASIGYQSYRLVPGLSLLAPFDAQHDTDTYLLNLFCCRPDRAARLMMLDIIAAEMPASPPAPESRHGWEHALLALPYGTGLAGDWQRNAAAGRSVEVVALLALFAQSQDDRLPGPVRLAALSAAYAGMKRLAEHAPSMTRLLSLARIARAFGAREVAVRALGQALGMIFERNEMDLAEPFLAPGERFDHVSPEGQIGNWVVAAALEEFERTSLFSSYYSGPDARQRLGIIRDLNFGSEEMQRRLALVEQRELARA